jgi:proteasome accessory factor C
VAWALDGSLPRVTVRLHPAARWVVEQYPVDTVVELDDGTVDATFAVLSERWLELLLLRAGPDATVVEPRAYRHLARDAARRLLARYEPAAAAATGSAVKRGSP